MNSKNKNNLVPVIVLENITNERMRRLKNLFEQEFYRSPTFFVRVPGRVNIIGEHIDYCGYPVLPMALEQDIIIAGATRSDFELHLRNVDTKFSNYNTTMETFEKLNIEPDENGKPYWYNYVLCGLKGGMEFLNNKIRHGLELYFDGNIPPASGLSSSSALVSASCLAFLYAQNAELSKNDIASLCAESERYIGTQGGGMDQAIAFLAQKYSAQYISFNPLSATPVALPENAAFVVAHSLAEANKAATNDFNRRVIECRLAAQILANQGGFVTNNKIVTLRQVQKNLGKTLDQMIELVHKALPKDIYTKADTCSLLNLSEEDIDRIFMTENTKHITEFKLKQRALHVYEEASRVEKFREICKNPEKTEDILKELGELMSGSHESLKSLYECSHDNLDTIVDISKETGISARLTGAGWGGCTVALCHRDDVEKYIQVLKKKFYSEYCKLENNGKDSFVFATSPNEGATIYMVQS